MSATQPITLITATPGGGKTALAVKLMKEAADKGRPIFQLGIPELKLPYIPTPPVKEWTEKRIDPEDPDQNELDYFTFPENSLIVLDEAQRIFRVRPTGAKVPDHVAAFETVRHTGVTFLLMTQNPTFLDAHIRKLVGQHIHLRDVGLLGRWYYEWPECSNPETFASAPIKKKYVLPKESFPLYKSSSLHIKRRYTVPPTLMMLIACIALALFLGWRMYSSIQQKTTPGEAAPAAGLQSVLGASSPEAVPVVKGAAAAPPSVRTNDGGEYLAAFVPVVSGRPESAPAYAELRQVKAMPIVVGGACTASHCKCYNQQGRDAGLDEMQCRNWLKSPPFDPYRDPVASPVDALAAPVADDQRAAQGVTLRSVSGA